MRVVVTFTIGVDEPTMDEAVDSVCALLPPGCEDIVIVSEEDRDWCRTVEQDRSWRTEEP